MPLNRLSNSFSPGTDWNRRARAAATLGRWHCGGYRQLEPDRNLESMFLRAQRRFENEKSISHMYTYRLIEEPLDNIGVEIGRQIGHWKDEWRVKIDNTKWFDRLESENHFEGLDALSQADPVPHPKGLIRGSLYKMQQMGLWKQNPVLNESQHEDDAWDSQSDCSNGQRRRPVLNPVTDIKNWVLSEAWMRPVMPDLEHSNTETDCFSREDVCYSDYDKSEAASFLTWNDPDELCGAGDSLEPESATGDMIWDDEQSTVRPPTEQAETSGWFVGDDVLWPWQKTFRSSDKETDDELRSHNWHCDTDQEDAAHEEVTTKQRLVDSDNYQPWDAEEELIQDLRNWKPVAYLRSFFSSPVDH